MRSVKRWAVIAVGILAMAGCKPKEGGATDSGKRYSIGISIPTGDHGWTAGVGYWAKQAQAAHPEIDWQYAQAGDADKQKKDIEVMMTRGVDAIVIDPTDPGSLSDLIGTAHKRGIFIVNVDRGLPPNKDGPVSDVFIEGDNKAFGRRSAEYICQKMHDTGNLVILQGMDNQVNTDRVDAAMAVFKAHGITPLASPSAGWDRDKGLSVMKTLLAKYPHIDAVWAGDDDVALGAIQAIKDVGRDKEMWVVGGAGMKDVVKMIMDGDPMIPADVTYPPSMIGTGIHLAASAVRNGKLEQLKPMLPAHLTLDADLVTKENAKRFYFPDSAY
jgi:ribose transport system substrate-binding protein